MAPLSKARGAQFLRGRSGGAGDGGCTVAAVCFLGAAAAAVALFVSRAGALLEGAGGGGGGRLRLVPPGGDGGAPAPDAVEGLLEQAGGGEGEEEQPSLGPEPSPSVVPTVPVTAPFKAWAPGAWGPETVGAEPEPWLNWALTGGRDMDLYLAQNDAAKRKAEYGGSWRTPVVVVPATYNEFIGDTPGWLPELLTSWKRSLYLYQRLDADKPHLAHNIGFESGIYLRFIVDHYDDLPEVTVFVHGIPDGHNPAWRAWVGCLRPNMSYSSLNTEYVEERAVTGDEPSLEFTPHQHFTEQCMRDTLELVGAPHPPRQPLRFRTYCCAQFAVHRDTLRRRPRAVWQALYERFGAPPGLCHRGPPRPLDELVTSAPEVMAHQRPWGPEVDDHPTHGKVVLGLTMEHLSGTVFGFEPWAMAGPYGQGHYCAQFFPASQCPGSPCEG